MTSATQHHYKQGDPFPFVHFYFPTIVIDTQALYVFDVKSGRLEPVDRFVLADTIDEGGVSERELVEFVRADCISELQARYLETAQRCDGVLQRYGDAIEVLAHADVQAQSESFRTIIARSSARKL